MAVETSSLLRALEVVGVSECLVRVLDAPTIAQLSACSRTLADCFGSNHVWRPLVAARWGSVPAVDVNAKREYAHRDLFERWGLLPPDERPQRPINLNAHQHIAAAPWGQQVELDTSPSSSCLSPADT